MLTGESPLSPSYTCCDEALTLSVPVSAVTQPTITDVRSDDEGDDDEPDEDDVKNKDD